jgi:molecular chaperone DnaJ
MNPYEVLGVSSSASLDEIEESYRTLVKKIHPDINQDDPEASNKFKEVQNAYDLLKKLKGSSSSSFEGMRFRNRSGFTDFEINVNEFFSKSSFKGRNIQAKVEVSLSEVLSGSNKELLIKKRLVCTDCSGHGFSDFVSCEECNGEGSINIKQSPFNLSGPCGFCGGTGRINIKKCSTCSGRGYSSYEEKNIKVEVPSGVEHGSQIILPGEGERSLKGGKDGDLIILVTIKNDNFFRREGSQLYLEVPVSYTQLVFGCELTVPCITGETILLKVPPSTSTSTKFRIRGKGIPYRGSIGDMLITLKLEIPKEVSEDYKSCLETLSFLEKKNITNSRKKWIENFRKEKL